MAESLLKEELDKKTKQIIEEIEGDLYCKKLIEIFSKVPLSPKLVRELKSSDCKFFKNYSFFDTNKNISKLHTCLTNQRACAIFLLLDEGYNLTQIANKIIGKSKKKGKNIRESVRNWVKKYEDLGFAKLSGLSKDQEKIYEKIYEDRELTQFLNYMCIRNVRLTSARIIKDSIPEDVLKRNYI